MTEKLTLPQYNTYIDKPVYDELDETRYLSLTDDAKILKWIRNHKDFLYAIENIRDFNRTCKAFRYLPSKKYSLKKSINRYFGSIEKLLDILPPPADFEKIDYGYDGIFVPLSIADCMEHRAKKEEQEKEREMFKKMLETMRNISEDELLC